MAAISTATRSGSSLGKWDTVSMTMKEWEEPNWRSPILPIFKLKSPTPTQVGGVELFKTVTQES